MLPILRHQLDPATRNPMRIEQRIGRVDRIGQKGVVRALNLAVEESVEHRVREVLEAKLQTILDEFGIDKASDVLNSAEAEEDFEAVYVEAMLNPRQLDQKVDTLLSLVRSRARAEHDGLACSEARYASTQRSREVSRIIRSPAGWSV